MTKTLTLVLFFFSLAHSAQEAACMLIAEIPLKADRFTGIDDFDNLYYVDNNVLYKEGKEATIRYNNLQLGNIGSIDILNPLEITVFYPDFNTVIKLDNTLNEIIKIDFNHTKKFRNIQYVTTANDKNLWTFNSDLQQLEIFNYQTRETIPANQPLSREVIAQGSNYNFCWLLTPKELLKYNSYGSLLEITPLEDYDAFSQSGGDIILRKNNTLFYKKDNSGQITPLKISGIGIKDFYIKGNNLYIYDGKNLYHYQLNFSKKE